MSSKERVNEQTLERANVIKSRIRRAAGGKAIFWSFAVIIIAMIPILISFLFDTIDGDSKFSIYNHIKNGNLIIVALGISGAAWIDKSFAIKNDSNVKVNFTMFLILIFSIPTFIKLNMLSQSTNTEVDPEGASIICVCLLAGSFMYSLLVKYSIFINDEELLETKS